MIGPMLQQTFSVTIYDLGECGAGMSASSLVRWRKIEGPGARIGVGIKTNSLVVH